MPKNKKNYQKAQMDHKQTPGLIWHTYLINTCFFVWVKMLLRMLGLARDDEMRHNKSTTVFFLMLNNIEWNKQEEKEINND
jgi:hypothetical protein